MKQPYPFVFSVAAIFASLLFIGGPSSAEAQDGTRILFIGNSYTGQIRNTVTKLIEASSRGSRTELEFITPGGKTLEFHLQNEATTRRIAEGNWDFVVLQDQSQTPAIFPQRFEDAAVGLDKLIDAAGAKTVFYQTWGRRDGDKQNAHMFPTYQSMQKALSENYASAAKRCDAILAPVGDVWSEVRQADADLGSSLYKGDGSHPSASGAYLAACVLYSAIFELPPQKIPYRGGVAEDDAAVILQAVGRVAAPDRTDSSVAGPIKVFVLAGQSNMQGQGVVSMDDSKSYNGGKGNLVWSMQHSPSAEKMQHLRSANGEWTVRDDVEISYQAKDVVRKGSLTIGYTGYGGQSHIGPELQFGHVIGDHFDEPVLLIKTAWGGKSLHVDFRPPSSGGETGRYYLEMIEQVRAALMALHPQKFEIAGFVWMQGWNDMVTAEAIPEYSQNLINLVKDLREKFRVPNLPVVIGELGNGGPAPAGSAMSEFRKAQEQGADQIKNAVFVKTTDFARPKDRSPNTGHGHHWFGNAESYFLVGDALAKAMLELMSSAATDQK